jgi:hypothetical protein
MFYLDSNFRALAVLAFGELDVDIIRALDVLQACRSAYMATYNKLPLDEDLLEEALPE